MNASTRIAMLVVLSLSLLPATSVAQTLGTFRWQLSPYCNVLTMTVVQQGAFYVLTGIDDGCGTTAPSPVTGTAFLDGANVRMGLHAVAPSGRGRSYSVAISPTTFGGSWTDGDDAGTFVFSPGVPTVGSPRPTTVESVYAYGHIREDGSIRNGSSRLVSVERPVTGGYCLNFASSVPQVRAEGMVVGLAGGGSAAIFARNTEGQAIGFSCANPAALKVWIVNSSAVGTNGRFSFVIP